MTYSRPGMTVNPVFNDDGTEEQIVDFEVQRGPRLRNGMAPDADQYFQENEQGRFVFQEDDYSEEYDDGIRFNEEAYIEALLESDPDIGASLQWAQNALPPDLIAEFNDVMNNGDIDEINKQLEWLLTLYREENPEAFEDSEEYEEEEEEEIDDAEFYEAVEGLMETEPEGTETAFAFLEAAQDAEDPAFRDAYLLTAQYHRQEIGSEEAIQTLIQNHGLAAAARVFRQMNS